MTSVQAAQITFASTFAGIGGFDKAWDDLGMRCVLQVEIDANRRALLARHWPDVPRGEDINDVHGTELGRPDILVGGFPCFPAGTLIRTSERLLPIEEVAVGMDVLTHQRRWRKVVQTMNRTAGHRIEVKVQGAPLMRTTNEHPYYVRRTPAASPEWIKAADLQHGMFVALPDEPSAPSERAVSTKESAEWYLVGAWLGNGWTVTHQRTSKVPAGHRGSRINSLAQRVHWSCPPYKADTLLDAFRAAEIKPTKVAERETVWKFVKQSKVWAERLASFGQYAHGKHLPEFVFSLPRELQVELLRGYLDADGHLRADGVTVSTTVSRALAISIARLARSLTGNIVSIYDNTVPITTVIEGRQVNQRPAYAVHFSPAPAKQAFRADGFMWSPVRTVNRIEESQDVYNIAVEEDESYVADGVVVHNCKDISIGKSKRKGLAGSRSGLFWEFHRLAEQHLRLVDAARPRFTVLENVPGLLTSNGGRDLAAVLLALEDIGYGWAYRVVDSRGVAGSPQRRPRIVIVGHRGGDPRPARLVLADTVGRRVDLEVRAEQAREQRAAARGAAVDAGVHVFRKSSRPRATAELGGYATYKEDGFLNVLNNNDSRSNAMQTHVILQNGRLRAPTPLEWERAQGFPDNWTAGMPERARYEALGDAMHVDIAKWLGRNIMEVDAAIPLLPERIGA